MHFPTRLLIAAVAIVCLTQSAICQVLVNGYFRNDGIYVPPHYRSSPDGYVYNNWGAANNGVYPGIRVDRRGTTIWYYDNSRERELEAERAHEQKLLQMQLDHERALLETEIKERKTDKRDAQEFLRRERARDAVLSSKISANLTNPYTSASRQLKDENAPVPSAGLQAIEFDGLRAFDSEQAFLSSVPVCEPRQQSDQHYEYVVRLPSGQRAVYKFMDGQLLLCEVTYDAAQIKLLGGSEVLKERAKHQFGTPIRDEPASVVWVLQGRDRIVMAGPDGADWTLIIARRSAIPDDALPRIIGQQ